MAGIEVYEDVTYLGFYLFCLWLSAWLCRQVRLTPIVGQICTGILFGPQGISFVPLFDGFNELNKIQDYCYDENITFPTNEYDDLFPERKQVTNFLIVLGNIGVTFLIFESGMHIDFEIVKKVGVSAVGVAILGTVLSYLLGMLFAYLFGFGVYPQGVAMGAVIAPTSVGIALKILSDSRVLDSTFGQTIVTAAFTDDIFSLISLALLVQLAQGEGTVSSFARPIGLTASIILVSLLLATQIFPKLFPFILRKLSSNRDRVHFFILLVGLSLFGYIGTFVGSHLLGAFFAGVSFSQVPRTGQVWNHMAASVTVWLLAIFFGATVAFQVPVDQLANLENFWKGAILGFGCILVKVFSGFHLKHRWTVGWAMVSRGEFSFLVGETLETTEYLDTGDPFLSEEAFGIAVWALLIAIFVAPVCFEVVLKKSINGEDIVPSKNPTLTQASHYIDDDKRSMTKVSTVNILKSILRSKQEFYTNIWVVKIISDTSQSSLFQDIVEVFIARKITVIRFERTSNGIEFNIELPESNSSARDDYLLFDISKFVKRLRNRIQSLLIIDAELIIERVELPNMSSMNNFRSVNKGTSQISLSRFEI